MAQGEADAVASEIIIVRRKKSEEGGHGSTAWKIAFADFMTAMMALFLVLWLTNSTDDATKKQIATYFNPLKLADNTPTPKGVTAETSQMPSEGEKEQMKPGSDEHAGSRREAVGSLENGPAPVDERLFRDPYDLIRRLTTEGKQVGANEGVASAGQADGGPATRAGEAYRDPFDPVFRSEVLEASRQEASGQKQAGDTGADRAADDLQEPDAGEPPDAVVVASPSEGVAGAKPEQDAPVEHEDEADADAVTDTDTEAIADAVRKAALKDEARRIAEDVEAAIGNLGAGAVAKIEVSVEPAGILISLTDNDKFGMFASASALPNPKLVELMGTMSGVLKKQSGKIVIRGHTDGLRFREGTSDNWRLSMARAYSAYAMLLDSGVDESRIGRIEGHADKKLRNTRDIGSASNRRIEILLERNPI